MNFRKNILPANIIQLLQLSFSLNLKPKVPLFILIFWWVEMLFQDDSLDFRQV